MKSKKPCAHPGCRENVQAHINKSGMCLTHYNATRKAVLRSCPCGAPIRKHNKGGLCMYCKVMENARDCVKCGKKFSGKKTKCGRCEICRKRSPAGAAASALPKIEALEPAQPKAPFSIGDLVKAATFVTMTKEDEIKGISRKAWLVNIRFAIIHLALPYYSTTQIGNVLCRDHSTVVHGGQQAEIKLEQLAFSGLVNAIRRETLAAKELQRLAA